MTEPAPIVLIGAARSGTKFLRDVLAAGPGVRAVPYDVNYVWRIGAEDAADDRLDPSTLTEARRKAIPENLQRLAGAGPGTVLVEKSVSNTLRVPFVAAALPGARFVHLVRDGRDVVESAMRQWQAPPDWRALAGKLRGMPRVSLGYMVWFARNFAKGTLAGRGGGKVWGPRYPGIEDDVQTLSLPRVCARQWARSVETASDDLAGLAGHEVHTIRYEDLVRDEAALAALAEALRLPSPEATLAAYRDRVDRRRAQGWAALSEAARAEILDEIAPSLARLGYPA